LRPEPEPLLDPQGEYLTSAWQNHVYPLARSMNMPLTMPPIQVRSRKAHEAAKWAAGQGFFAEYNEAIFRAFFQFGKDISDIDVLAGLCSETNQESYDLVTVLNNGDFTAQVVEDKEEAVKIGVRAVPAFAVDGRVLAAGVQTSSRLLELVKQSKLPRIIP